jgi:hypothetical protein
MGKTLNISDDLYDRLDQAARQRGLKNVEQLLETWQSYQGDLHKRQKVVERIDALRERFFSTYGQMPDSVDLICEDRGR